VFHYLSSGTATLALEPGRKLRMTEGDFVLLTPGEPHVIYPIAGPSRRHDVGLGRSAFSARFHQAGR
jgi:hypothetical protein